MSHKNKKKRPPYLEIIMGELILLMLLVSLSIHLVHTKGFSITLPTGKINLVEGIDKQLTKRAVEAVLSEKAGVSIDLDAIDTRYMTAEDIQMLNDYHKHVYERIAPLVDEETRTWLAGYTREV